MAQITARVPRIDWSHGFDRFWLEGNPAVSHVFDALSFMFPQGEKFFIDVAREVAAGMGGGADPALAAAVREFVAQESIHSHQHNQYNAILEKLGYENVVREFIDRLNERAQRDFSPLTRLAVVCAYEHYTAVLGNFILGNPQVLQAAPPAMALIWGWHAAEETEHKAVCFDLYRAAGGGWFTRAWVFVLVSVNFNLIFSRLYLSMLHRDGCLKPARLAATLGRSLRFFFGRRGVGWHLLGHGYRYLSPGFHPWKQDNRDRMQAWLAANQAQLREVA